MAPKDKDADEIVPANRETGTEVVYGESSEEDIINAMLAEHYEEDSPESIALHLLLDEDEE